MVLLPKGQNWTWALISGAVRPYRFFDGGWVLRVLNVMLSSGLGGIQASFSGYTKLLQSLGHDVTCCVMPRARIIADLPADIRLVRLFNLFEGDPIAIARAAFLLRSLRPDAVMVHGKRAAVIFSWALKLAGRKIPLVLIQHRHRFKHIAAADLVICVSERLRQETASHGIHERKLAFVPNFLPDDFPAARAQPWHDPPTIGFLGRMVPEKGLDVLIDALRILKNSGTPFRARIGGDGPLRAPLVDQAAIAGLSHDIQWLGWVDDIGAFHNSIDILCVPSRAESFGLVILGAFRARKPVVATSTIGPSEIIIDKNNGLLCAVDATELAANLRVLLDNPDFAMRLADQASHDVAQYRTSAQAPKVDALLKGLVVRFKRESGQSP